MEGATRAGDGDCTIYWGGGRLEEALGQRTRAPSLGQQWQLRLSAGIVGGEKRDAAWGRVTVMERGTRDRASLMSQQGSMQRLERHDRAHMALHRLSVARTSGASTST
jgi:hypothetical protein